MNFKNRRDFFKAALFGALALPLVKSNSAFAELAKACPQGAPSDAKIKKKLIDDKTAKRLDFVNNAVDAKANKKYVAGANCVNCNFYKADKKEPVYGKCSMAAMKYVPSCGWCKQHKMKKKKG